MAALVGVFAQGSLRDLRWPVILWLVGMVLLTVGVSWRETRAIPVLCSLPLKGFAVGQSREDSLLLLLGEFYSWAWLVGVMVYLLPAVVLPQANSYSLSSVLWARLTPCSPREVALARMARVVVGFVALSVLGVSWALTCAVYHGLPANRLLNLVVGMPAHLLCSAGVVAVLGRIPRTDAGRVVIGLAALLLPVGSFLAFATLVLRSAVPGKDHWPYAAPFTTAVVAPGQHFLVCAALGMVLLVVSVLVRQGRIVGPSRVSPKESV